jgi:hypothetical protein
MSLMLFVMLSPPLVVISMTALLLKAILFP